MQAHLVSFNLNSEFLKSYLAVLRVRKCFCVLGDELEETQYIMERESRKRKAPFEHQEAPQAQYIYWDSKLLCSGYGNTGYGVSSPGIQNWKDFCLIINIPKGNY